VTDASNKTPLTYEASGVSPAKAANVLARFVAERGSRPPAEGVLAGIGPFAACFSLSAVTGRYADPVLVTSCDGVGTKALLAAEWDKVDGLGFDLVAMNVNDLLCAGATPSLFLDYYACGELRETQLLPLLKSIDAACTEAGCTLVGGETAEMPGVYRVGDFDLAGFAIGFADRSALLGPARVEAGDAILAVASKGFHSNGYSLVRKLVDREKLSPDAPNPFDGRSWRDTLLEPTAIYVRALAPMLPVLHAAVHITGGGLEENVPRVLPEGLSAVFRRRDWELPPLFRWAQATAKIDDRALRNTFNCGVGMLLVVPQARAQDALDVVTRAGHRAWSIGHVEPRGDGEAVRWSDA
jgi:phosphoribosylformylglycinamidine cyclo-ligase